MCKAPDLATVLGEEARSGTASPGGSTSGSSSPTTSEPKLQVRDAVWSSGVPFYPPSKSLWRIGGKWYDLEPFLKKHPGGEEVVRLSRDRYEDATYAFESHHHNYSRARSVIAK